MSTDDLRQMWSHPTTWPVKQQAMPDIVHCRDCIYRDRDFAMCEIAHYSVGPNDYCSKGERRDDE